MTMTSASTVAIVSTLVELSLHQVSIFFVTVRYDVIVLRDLEALLGVNEMLSQTLSLLTAAPTLGCQLRCKSVCIVTLHEELTRYIS